MGIADRRILPAAQAILIDNAGRATPSFYDFLRRLIDSTQLTPELVAQIQQLLKQFEQIENGAFIPITANVEGDQSILSQGSLPAGEIVHLSLRNDTIEQRGTWYYGSDADADKGWYRFYTALAAGAGLLKRNSGYIELGEVDDPEDLPGSGNAGEAYWVSGLNDVTNRGLWAWDGSDWIFEPTASGVVGFEVANADYGDITVTGDGATWTINPNAVTDAKLRDSAALSVIGRPSDSDGDPEDILASADKAVLHRDDTVLVFSTIDHTYISDFDAAAQAAVGPIPPDLSALTFLTKDDETATAPNSWLVAPGANVTFDDTTTPGTIYINSSGGGGGGGVSTVNSGTGISVNNGDPENPIINLSSGSIASLALADSAVQPGDLAAVAFTGDYGDLVGAPAGANPSAQVGLTAVNGSSTDYMRADAAPALDVSISPTWSGTHTFSNTPAVPDDSWALAKIQDIASGSFLGRVTASTGDVEELTGTQATTLLDTFTDTLQGLAPASGGGTTNFLRADGNWAAPSGGGGTPADPTASVGLTVVNGSATTYMRSDAAPPLDQGIAPTWTSLHTFSNGVLGANFTSTVQVSERIRLAGQEYTAPATTSTDGVSLVLGVNRSNNRQLWLVDSARLATNNTNPFFRIGILTNSATFDCLSTDTTVAFPITTASTVLIKRTTNSNAAFALEVGTGTADTRARINPSTVFAVGVSQGASNGTFYVGATAAANPDFVFSNNAGTEIAAVMGDGRMYGRFLHNHPSSVGGTTNQYFASGTYAPIATNVSNVSGSSAVVAQWSRIGNVVTVSGSLNVTVANVAAVTQFRIPLPLASNLTSAGNLGGSIGRYNSETYGVSGDAANDAAFVDLPSSVLPSGSVPLTFNFTYLIG